MERKGCEFIEFQPYECPDGKWDVVMIFCGPKHTVSYADKCGDEATHTANFGCQHTNGSGEDRKTCSCPEGFPLCERHWLAFVKWHEGFNEGQIEPA